MTYQEYCELSRRVNAMAERISRLRTARGFAVALAAGICPDMCCVHNASCDEGLTGWCHKNPARLKAAKRAKRILDDWSHARLAERIIARAWAKVER